MASYGAPMRVPDDSWEAGAGWWLDVVADDPIYETDVMPLLRTMVGRAGGPWLDLGCGEGRAASALPSPRLGCDVSPELLSAARTSHPVVRARLPDLRWVRPATLGGASAVLVLEHLADLSGLFEGVLTAVKPGGVLVVIANHPAFTAEGAGPVVDPSDGEVLWRWGAYFRPHRVVVPHDGHGVLYHHRPLSTLLTSACGAGWLLDAVEERPLGAAAVASEPGYAGQEQVPRLLGLRWRR